MLDKARVALSTLAAEKNGYPSRKALACLAALAFYLRDYDRALPVFQQYVTTYPSSSWTWLASLRIGRIYEAREDWKAAADQYQRAAKTFGSESFAG
jgi:TolA-binding protein